MRQDIIDHQKGLPPLKANSRAVITENVLISMFDLNSQLSILRLFISDDLIAILRLGPIAQQSQFSKDIVHTQGGSLGETSLSHTRIWDRERRTRHRLGSHG